MPHSSHAKRTHIPYKFLNYTADCRAIYHFVITYMRHITRRLVLRICIYPGQIYMNHEKVLESHSKYSFFVALQLSIASNSIAVPVV
jgi:hypothetical protein